MKQAGEQGPFCQWAVSLTLIPQPEFLYSPIYTRSVNCTSGEEDKQGSQLDLVVVSIGN